MVIGGTPKKYGTKEIFPAIIPLLFGSGISPAWGSYLPMVLVLTPADIFEQKEENARLYEALASLPEKQRNRITSHFLLGMSLSDIAKSEGTGVSSVHEGIQRGLRRLKKILEKMNTDPENYHQK